MVIHGDCKILIKDYPDNSIDCCVCDPPYGLEFMGKEWDKLDRVSFHKGEPQMFQKGGTISLPPTPKLNQSKGKKCDKCGKYAGGNPKMNCICENPAFRNMSRGNEQYEWHYKWASEVFRVLKPGAYLLAFGGTRTYHRLACAIEDAGFEIRDMIEYLYGSGFPKALDVSKSIDKMKGAKREKIGEYTHPDGNHRNWEDHLQSNGNIHYGHDRGMERILTTATTPEAKYWEGWKSALKPAHEPICVARKPLDGTIAENCLKWGVGAMNIDVSRITTNEDLSIQRNGNKKLDTQKQGWGFKAVSRGTQGRYPANLIFDEVAGAMLDEQSGDCKVGWSNKDGKHTNSNNYNVDFGGARTGQTGNHYQDTKTGASRFFYCAKSSRSERNAGLEGMEEKPATKMDGGTFESASTTATTRTAQNFHPCVKPISLMKYLINLVSREGQTVLDPFTGSGTTGIACALLNREFIGFEQEAEYVEIANKRIEYWSKKKEEQKASEPELFI